MAFKTSIRFSPPPQLGVPISSVGFIGATCCRCGSHGLNFVSPVRYSLATRTFRFLRRVSTVALNRPFGFVALLGVIALLGMIQRNSVILIDQIEQDRARGVPTWDAIVEAAVRRFRPIVLTDAAAVLAMIPLSRSVFWGPMAVAIMGGLVVATVLTLLFLPALYAAWFRVKRAAAAP